MVSEKLGVGRSERLFLSFFFFCLAGLSLIGAFHFYKKANGVPGYKLSTINDIVISKTSLERGKSHSFVIKLRSYANYFEISGSGLAGTDVAGLFENIEIGDTLWVQILREEYERMTTEKKATIFTVNPFKRGNVTVYGLRGKNNIYLAVSDYNLKNKFQSKIAAVVFLIAGLAVFGTGFKFLR